MRFTGLGVITVIDIYTPRDFDSVDIAYIHDDHGNPVTILLYRTAAAVLITFGEEHTKDMYATIPDAIFGAVSRDGLTIYPDREAWPILKDENFEFTEPDNRRLVNAGLFNPDEVKFARGSTIHYACLRGANLLTINPTYFEVHSSVNPDTPICVTNPHRQICVNKMRGAL